MLLYFLVLRITPKSRAKVCAQWRILKPPVACATERSKAVIWCGSYSIRLQEIQLCVVCFCCGSFNLFYCINLLVAGYYFNYGLSYFYLLPFLSACPHWGRMIVFCLRMF